MIPDDADGSYPDDADGSDLDDADTDAFDFAIVSSSYLFNTSLMICNLQTLNSLLMWVTIRRDLERCLAA